MKSLHRHDLYSWSQFDEARNIDFHSVLWVRPEGNVLFDPLPLTEHDKAHLQQLGGAAWIVLTNSDHTRAAEEIAQWTGAQLAGPKQEAGSFPLACTHWLQDGDELVPGLQAFELDGSKTPGELALLLDNSTLIVGDLIRAHQAGRLCLLPAAKLQDRAAALDSVERLVTLGGIEAVLTGDGWPVFRDGSYALKELLREARGA